MVASPGFPVSTGRVALPAVLTTHLLVPHFSEFRLAHPDIKLHVITSYSMADLAKREADKASPCMGVGMGASLPNKVWQKKQPL